MKLFTLYFVLITFSFEVTVFVKGDVLIQTIDDMNKRLNRNEAILQNTSDRLIEAEKSLKLTGVELGRCQNEQQNLKRKNKFLLDKLKTLEVS